MAYLFLTDSEQLILGTHDCTADDRGLFYDQADEDESYQIEKDFSDSICLDDPSLVNLMGSVQSKQKSVLSLYLFRCSGKAECKSEEEIDRFINAHYFEIIYNQQSYVPTNYGEDEIIRNHIAT